MKLQLDTSLLTLFWFLCIGPALTVIATAESLGQGNFTSLVDAFPQLADLDENPHRKPTDGGQNFTHCCLLAVNQSLELVNGSIIEKPPFFINATVDTLLTATAAGEFPCGAVWNGDRDGAPIVEVPYSWLIDTCPGWQLSDTKKGDDSEFISPFVGFLLPAVVFCLTIPRRRKLAVWQKLFMPDLSKLRSYVFAPFAMILAGIFVICDTIVWLSMCFAFASPMLLSGFYEAFLDNRIINFLIEKQRNFRLTLDMKARLLFVILVGNLDLEPEPRDMDAEFVVLGNNHRDDDSRWPNRNDTLYRNPSSPWTHIENLIYPLRSYRDQSVGTPRQHPIHDINCAVERCSDLAHKEVPIKRNQYVQKEIGRTKTRLRTMLACQYSFGSTVGAPVVFFLGAFVFNIVTALEALGDESTSLSLAFGMWYMIIPHLAIVSGLLLAGNNPNTLEGVIALEVGDIEEEAEDDFEKKHFGTKLFELAYDSRYRPSWIWMRGRSKREWVEKVLQTYQYRAGPGSNHQDLVCDEDMKELRKETTLSLLDWATVMLLTILLIGVPFVLAFITGYYTPQVGLSCRSLTFMVYTICQLSQLVLWFWAYANAPEQVPYCSFICKGGWLDKNGFYTPTSVTGLLSRNTFFSLRSLWAVIWYNLATIFGLGGVITSIGGTTMQLMGVYSSAKCDIDAIWWTRPNGNVKVIISTNYKEEINDADTYWKACAVAATAFLGVVSFCGWWYQRRLRGLFRELVSNIGNPKYDREDIRDRRVGERAQNGQARHI